MRGNTIVAFQHMEDKTPYEIQKTLAHSSCQWVERTPPSSKTHVYKEQYTKAKPTPPVRLAPWKVNWMAAPSVEKVKRYTLD